MAAVSSEKLRTLLRAFIGSNCKFEISKAFNLFKRTDKRVRQNLPEFLGAEISWFGERQARSSLVVCLIICSRLASLCGREYFVTVLAYSTHVLFSFIKNVISALNIFPEKCIFKVERSVDQADWLI